MDMIVRLLGENKLTPTMEAGRKSVWSLNQQLDKLTSSMEQESNAEGVSARQKQVLALADKGASAAKVEYALALAAELDSLDELKAAEEQESAAKAKAEKAAATMQARVDSLVASVKKEYMEVTKGAAATAAYQARLNGASTELAEEIAETILNTEAQKRLTAQRKENAAWVQRTLDGLHAQNTARTQTTLQTQRQELVQRGATAAERDEFEVLNLVNYALEETTQKKGRLAGQTQRTTQTMQQSSSQTTRNTMALQSLAFGVQDAAQVYGSTGLAGALMASANNMIFATQMIAPHLSIYVALGVAVAQFSAVLLPTIFNTKALAKEAEELAKVWEKDIDLILKRTEAQREFNKALEEAESRSEANSLVSKTKNEGKDLEAEIATRRGILSDLSAKFQEAKAEEAAYYRQKPLMSGMTAIGLNQAPGVAKQKEITSLIAKQQDELKQLEERRKTNAGQMPIADQNARAADAEQRAAEAREFNRKKIQDEQERDTKYIAEKQAAEKKAHEQFLQDRKKLELKTSLEMVDEDKAARMKVLNELAERQQQINTWLGEGRISQAEAMRLGFDSRQAAGRSLKELDDKKLRADGKDAISLAESQLKKDKKTFADQTDQKAQDLTAIDAGSAEGFKRVFEATAGGGGKDNPLFEVRENTKRMTEYMRLYLAAAELQIEEMKKKQVIKTGPA